MGIPSWNPMAGIDLATHPGRFSPGFGCLFRCQLTLRMAMEKNVSKGQTIST